MTPLPGDPDWLDPAQIALREARRREAEAAQGAGLDARVDALEAAAGGGGGGGLLTSFVAAEEAPVGDSMALLPTPAALTWEQSAAGLVAIFVLFEARTTFTDGHYELRLDGVGIPPMTEAIDTVANAAYQWYRYTGNTVTKDADSRTTALAIRAAAGEHTLALYGKAAHIRFRNRYLAVMPPA